MSNFYNGYSEHVVIVSRKEELYVGTYIRRFSTRFIGCRA